MPILKKILFFSSAWGNEELFAHQIKALSPEYEVVFPNIHSYQSISEMAEHVLNHYQKEDIACLIGISMGGFIVQEILIRQPDFSPKAVIIASFSQRHPEQVEDFLKHIMAEVQLGKLADIAPLFAQAVLSEKAFNNPGLRNIVETMPIKLGTQSCLNHHAACIGWRDHTDQLPSIQASTLIIASPEDAGAPLVQVQALKAIPHSEFKTIENSGHLIPLEQAAITTDLIREWLIKK
ncbi:MAG: alpha/beta hydrolase [Gammaproteobacteria bacterium]|nr:alpha/beta hydrolase [Gammaproteobacteria bacterium]